MTKTSLSGLVAGWAAAPFFAVTSFLRRARTFHPRGPVFHATVEARGDVPEELRALASRLVGPAIVRFSGALWKKTEALPDVLGCAVRFRRDASDSAEPATDDQDLLFATIRRPWTMPLAPLTTNVHDYLANDYFAVSPFDAGAERSIYLRAHPAHRSGEATGNRAERLARETAQGDGCLTIELGHRPFGPWTPLVDVTLVGPAAIDGDELRFRPFRAGRGLTPRGFVHALRIGVYALSQRGRELTSPQPNPAAAALP